VPAGANATATLGATSVAPATTGDEASASNLGRIFAGLLGVIVLLGAGAMASIVWARARR
jgi:hypothetical protein